ncbi:uncharacterized protein METZ01_LOCUS130809 [marine metagenome]|uniref:Uncharacterized protein n=1 Tax=marine metagenome TaxID=408172 RepID=A0A381YLQ3_9ZZZZ
MFLSIISPHNCKLGIEKQMISEDVIDLASLYIFLLH